MLSLIRKTKQLVGAIRKNGQLKSLSADQVPEMEVLVTEEVVTDKEVEKPAPIPTQIIPDDLRQAISLLKGRLPIADLNETSSFKDIFPISAQDSFRRIVRIRAEEAAIKSGQWVEGKGIFLGPWAPKDRDGKSLGKVFNLFAAPNDFGKFDQYRNFKRLLIIYNNAVDEIGSIKDYLGYDGASYSNDTELYNALRNGKYNGEWFIPTKDILNGKDMDGNAVQADNLFDRRLTNDFKGTFVTLDSGGKEKWYISCTEVKEEKRMIYVVDFPNDLIAHNHKFKHALSLRLVRAEPRL